MIELNASPQDTAEATFTPQDIFARVVKQEGLEARLVNT